MAKNRSETKKSVAEEEDSSTDNEGSESESESEPEKTQTQMQIAKSPSAAATKVTEASSTHAKIQAASSSSYETDTESDSESESESQRPAPIVKPTDHPRESAQTKPRKSGAEAKRPAPAADRENSPRRLNHRQTIRRNSYSRDWSEDDEIALLEGMIEYTEKENADPHTDLDAFHDFIRKSLHFTVSKNQLQNKIKRVRKKYINNAGKGKKGKEKSFSKPHEQKTYELSRKIWGKGDEKIEDKLGDSSSQVRLVHALMACNGEEKINKNSMKKAPVIEDAIETPEAAASSGWKNGVKRMEAENKAELNSLSQFMEKNKGIVIGEEKRNEIEKKRKAVVVAEIDLFLKELELIQEQVKATLEAMK
ncbi:PREDICTED: probable transcription factor At1g61730 [Ipomoea nil]|uniref:probable transcription factor At1g61730 n=1 Tax=Ipomoea nil TaxID=35883 RepID=UPI000900AAA2|nr:PREDICTED: probable transcription factor At1g61730 [Ipomoea nil]